MIVGVIYINSVRATPAEGIPGNYLLNKKIKNKFDIQISIRQNMQTNPRYKSTQHVKSQATRGQLFKASLA